MIKICKDRGLYYTILGNCVERDNQNFRCLPDPNMNKYLKFGYLCRSFWFLGFEKGLEVPQDPAYSWFQSGYEEHVKSGIMLLCCLLLVLPGLQNSGGMHKGLFVLKVVLESILLP